MTDNQNFQMSMYCAGSSYEDGIIEHDLFYEEFGFQYFTGNFEPDGFDCLRDKFIGPYRTEDNPLSVEKGQCGGSFELGNNHCGSLQKNITLEPGEEIRLVFMLGEGSREAGPENEGKNIILRRLWIFPMRNSGNTGTANSASFRFILPMRG